MLFFPDFGTNHFSKINWNLVVCILFCLLQNQCSVYYQQTSHRYSKNSYLDSAQFYWHKLIKKQESSGYRDKPQSTACLISFMDERNNKSPKIDLCGTPLSILAVLENLFLIFTWKFLLERYDWNHFIEK